jgi:allantoin racemase
VRLCLINPNSTESMTAEMADAGRAVAAPDTLVEGVTAESAPATIEGYRDDALAAAAVAEIVAERRGDYDAFVIACFGDPGLYAARELATVPVVGIAEASFMLAMTLGRTFSILTNSDADVPEMEDLVRRYGLAERSVGVRPVDMGVAEAEEDRDAAGRAYLAAGRQALEVDRAEVLCLGCGPMLGLRDSLESALGVPVIEGVPAAVAMAENLVRLGLRTSKARAFQSRDASGVA